MISRYLFISRQTFYLFAIYFFAGVVLYFNILDAPFVFDDFHVIADVGVERAFQQCRSPQRFFAHLSFALNLYLFGIDVRSYHVVNILIHIIAACALFTVLRQLLQLQEYSEEAPDRNFRVAAIAAGIFLVHPLATQSVTYICQRYTSLAACFTILSVAGYVRARALSLNKIGESTRSLRIFWYLAGLACGIFAMFTKEFPVSLPVLILFVEFFFISKFRIRTLPWKVMSPYLLTGLIVPYLYLGAPANQVDQIRAVSEDSMFKMPHWAPDIIDRGSYLYSQIEIIWEVYLKLLLLPVGQSFDHPYEIRNQFLSSDVLVPFIGLFILAAGAVFARKRFPFASAAVFWFLITLIPTSSFVPNKIFVAEHRVYLPMMALSFAAVELFQRMRTTRSMVLVAAPITIILSLLTISRNSVWQEDLWLWQDASRKAPAHDRPHMAVGDIYFERGEYEKAIEEYTAFLILNQTFSEGFIRLGRAYEKSNQNDAAIAEFMKAIQVNPDNTNTYKNLITVYTKKKNVSGVLNSYAQLLRLEPGVEEHHRNLGAYYVSLERWQEAASSYETALRYYPDDVQSLSNLGTIYKRLKLLERAETTYLKALSMAGPLEAAFIHYNIAELYRETNKVDAAIGHYMHVIQLSPGAARVHLALTSLFIEKGDLVTARKHAGIVTKLNAELDAETVRLLFPESLP